MAEQKKDLQKQDQNETKTTVSVEIKVHEKCERSERRETGSGDDKKAEMVPVTHTEKDFTVNFELSAEKVKSFIKIIGEGVGDYVKEKIAGEE